MSEQEFEALQQWKSNDILEGVRLLLTVTEVNNLSELLRLNKLAETYRRTFPHNS